MQLIDTQLKHNDCGVSVVKTICNIFGVKLSRSYIEQSLFLDAQGSRLSDIKAFFDHHGFEAIPQLLDLNLKDDSYYTAKLPFILPVDNKRGTHYVVVNGYKKGRFEILDPLENVPYYLTLAELRKRVHIAHSPLKDFSIKDQALVVCKRLLKEYGLDAETVVKELPSDDLFNKISYFLYTRDEFGFKDEDAEREFLKDLLFNQDMARLPLQFALLTDRGDVVTVRAPVVLAVKKTDLLSTVNLPRDDIESRNAFLVLYDALGGHRKNVLLYIAIALISVSFAQAYVFINQYFLDEILGLKNTSVITLFVLGLLGYFLLDMGLHLWKKWLAIIVAIRLDRLFLSSFDEKLNIYSLQYIQSYQKGDLTERLSDAVKLKDFFTTYLVNILVDSSVSIYILGVLLYLNWQLTSIVLVVMGLFYIWFKCITPYLQRNEQVRFARKSDFFSTMLEKMEGIQTLKCLGSERAFSGKISSNIDSLLAIQARTQRLDVLNSAVSGGISAVARLTLVWFLAYESAAYAALTLGEVVTFLTLSSHVFSSLGGLLNENLTVQENIIILRRYLNFREKREDVTAPYMAFPGRLESISLENISFGYHPEDLIVDSLSLTINRGDKIRIEGSNGSGKSTLSKVIALLYPVLGGTILINGEPLESYCKEAVREKILLVSNEDALFNDTILYNLTFQNATWDERIDVLAEKLDLSAWLRDVRSQGATYRISESGRNLSTGQRKKLLILRALLHPAEFVIFDEVLSGIDAAARVQIEQFFNTLTDKTCIFISHESINDISFKNTYTISEKRLAIVA